MKGWATRACGSIRPITLNLKQTNFGPLYRLGVHHNFAPGSDVIGHVSFQKADMGWVEPTMGRVDGDYKSDQWAGELQYIHTTGIFKAIIGGGFSDVNWDLSIHITLGPAGEIHF